MCLHKCTWLEQELLRNYSYFESKLSSLNSTCTIREVMSAYAAGHAHVIPLLERLLVLNPEKRITVRASVETHIRQMMRVQHSMFVAKATPLFVE